MAVLKCKMCGGDLNIVEGETKTTINELTYDEAIKEIAKIIANNDNNEAIKVVKELIKEVKNQKIFPF